MQYWLTCPMGVKSDPTVKSSACTLYGNNLRISRHLKSKTILNHDFTTAQPLPKSSGDQVNGTYKK